MALLFLLFLIGDVERNKMHVWSLEVEVTVNASLHCDVLLPCIFKADTDQVDLTHLLVTWEYNSTELIKYKKNDVKNNSRAVLLESNLLNRDASLLLKNVTIKDKGIYTCNVVYSPHQIKKNVSLKVIATPRISVRSNLAKMNMENTLPCTADGFYPSSINIAWFRDSERIKQETSLAPEEKADGTFSLVSYLTYKTQSSDAGVNFSCQAQHESQNEPLIFTFQLQFYSKYPFYIMVIIQV
ncbi:NR3L1 protein, partial [Polypterus senegalus]|nr:NR3L1 protein [Polypterus senegalus]